jgi:hypothetical protein
LLGHWKNYDELESSLSIDELMATLKASRDKDEREKKFLAAINGVDLDKEEETNDIIELQGIESRNQGFGIDEGLGFLELGE